MARKTPPRWQLPHARRGQVVGLLGGSFDPAHAGHAHITREALKRFGLNRVWWLVSPGNPLKAAGPASLARRMAAAKHVMQHPRVVVTDIEAQIGTRYTAQTLAALAGLYPGVRFVWLMGADNLAEFHQWGQWRRIIETVPIGILARPQERTEARHSRAANVYRHAQLRGRNSLLLPKGPAPLWCFVNVAMVNMSSSDIRARGDWVR